MGPKSIQPATAALFLLILTAVPLILAAGRTGALVGGWKPIKDPKSPEIKEIAAFAVDAYNKKYGAKLTLVDVLSGEQQVVAGMNYKLNLKAADGKATAEYVAVVYDVPWKHQRTLTSFEPAKH